MALCAFVWFACLFLYGEVRWFAGWRVILHSALRPSAVRSRFGARSNGCFSARPCHPMHRGEGPLTTPSRSPLISDRFVAPRHRRRHPAARHGSIIGGLLALLILYALIRARWRQGFRDKAGSFFNCNLLPQYAHCSLNGLRYSSFARAGGHGHAHTLRVVLCAAIGRRRCLRIVGANDLIMICISNDLTVIGRGCFVKNKKIPHNSPINRPL